MKLLQVALAGLGVVGLGLAAAIDEGRVEAQVESMTPRAEPKWPNTPGITYKCMDKDLVMCFDIPKVPCNQVRNCVDGCIQYDNGASCNEVPLLASRTDIEDSSMMAASGKCDGVPGTCRMCTPTGRGVFTCGSGFCAVRPGDWCSSDKSCHDDCNCCKKGKRDNKEARSLENTPQDQASTNSVALLDAVCKPADLWCHPVNHAWFLVCNGSGEWQIAADCGTNQGFGCCRGIEEPGPDHRCDCRASPRGITETKNSIEEEKSEKTKRSSEKEISAVKQTAGTVATTSSECVPGQFWCDQTNFDWTILCDLDGEWRKVLYCGTTLEGAGCCRGPSSPSEQSPTCECPSPSAGTPAFSHEKSTQPRAIESGDKAPMIMEDRSTEEPQCTPGTYRCRQPFLYGHLEVCNPESVWVISSLCCGPYTCEDPVGDTPAHCLCSPSQLGAETDLSSRSLEASDSANLEVRQETPPPNEPVPGPVCISGTYACGGRLRWIWVCDGGNWKFASDCKYEGACKTDSNGVPFCDPRMKVGQLTAEMPSTLLTVARDAMSTSTA